MLPLETALITFFRQFTDNVFLIARTPHDPTNILFPRITFDYASTDFFGRNLYNFNVWGLHTTDVFEIINKIEKAIPLKSGTTIDVCGNVIYEYFNFHSNEWVEFYLIDFNSIFQQHIDDWGFPPENEFQWQGTPGKITGKIAFYRGTPFLQPVADDEIGVVRYYGNIETGSYV